MAIIIYKNQTEHAFLEWINNSPESYHWCDMDRFYKFAKTVARYRSTTWLDYDNFKKRVLEKTSRLNEESVNTFHSKLKELVRFHGIAPFPDSDFDDRTGIFQRGVIKGERYEIEISRSEYEKGGVKNKIARML